MYQTLKKFLDKEMGDYAYIQILRHDKAYLCEGKVSELRSDPLWRLINEDYAKVKEAYTSYESEMNKKRCTTIVLCKPGKRGYHAVLSGLSNRTRSVSYTTVTL